MTEFLEGLGETFQKVLTILSSPIVQIALLGIVGVVIWRKIFGPSQTLQGAFSDTVDAAATLPAGALSAAESALLGQSESSYITPEEARQLAQKALERKLAGR